MPGFDASRKIKKVGMRGSPKGELIFDDRRVPAGNIVGELNRGVEVMTRGLDIEQVIAAGCALGIAYQALGYSIGYARERRQFGRPISSFQMIQAKLAEMDARYEAARNLTYKAAVLAEKSERGGKGTELTRLAAAAVLLAAEAAKRNRDDAVQIHGGTATAWNFRFRCFGGTPSCSK